MIVSQLLYVFTSDSGACLLPGVMKFKPCLVFHDLVFVAHDFRQAQHTHSYILIFQGLLGSLVVKLHCFFLRDLSVTNNGFEHARYALPHYKFPEKPL